MRGKVYLVGAGPGDPKLITLKGIECLKKAEAIIYDRLVEPTLLSYAKKGTEVIYVGKAGGKHTLPQEEINKLTVNKAKEGKVVVRLKGGDPFIFGRGAEEAEVLKGEKIPFEVVPGVSSAYAAPAYAGIPVTHRRYASMVTFVTGHEDPTKETAGIDWEELAKASGTFVFLMGIGNLSLIVGELIKQGKSKKTPVALVRWGTLPEQETLTGTLEDIAGKASEVNFKPPSIIVVGEVVNLRKKLNWFEEKPLFGKRVLVTRSRTQASELTEILEDLGASVVEFPTIKVEPPRSYRKLDGAITTLATSGQRPAARKKTENKLATGSWQLATGYDWLVFTSVNGVDHFFKRLKALKKDVRILKGVKLAAIGPATAQKLEEMGLSADFVPSEYRAEAVIEGFKKKEVAGKRVLIPRAEEAREILPKKLKELGAKVEVVSAYQTTLANSSTAQAEKLLSQGMDILTFTSSSTVKNFVKIFKGLSLKKSVLNGALTAAIGPITAKTAKELGLKVDVVAKDYTIPGLVKTIVEKCKMQNANIKKQNDI